MLNNFKINIKKLVKHPQNFLLSSSKAVVYIGLALYWSVIIVGTFLQIH